MAIRHRQCGRCQSGAEQVSLRCTMVELRVVSSVAQCAGTALPAFARCPSCPSPPPLDHFRQMPADSTPNCPRGSAGGCVVPVARGLSVIAFGKVLAARLGHGDSKFFRASSRGPMAGIGWRAKPFCICTFARARVPARNGPPRPPGSSNPLYRIPFADPEGGRGVALLVLHIAPEPAIEREPRAPEPGRASSGGSAAVGQPASARLSSPEGIGYAIARAGAACSAGRSKTSWNARQCSSSTRKALIEQGLLGRRAGALEHELGAHRPRAG